MIQPQRSSPRTMLGVGARLMLAFLAISAFSVAAALATLYLFRDVGTTVDRIAEREVPSALVALEMSAQAAHVTANGPVLLATTNQETYERLSRYAAGELDKLKGMLGSLRETGVSNAALNPINAAVSWIGLNVLSLDTLVASRIELAIEKAARLSELTEIQSQLGRTIAAIEPATPQSRVSDLAADRNAPSSGRVEAESAGGAETLVAPVPASLLAIQRELATVGALLVLGSSAPEQADLERLQSQSITSLQKLSHLVATLDADLEEIVQNEFRQLRAVAIGPKSLFALRTAELQSLESGRQVLVADRKASEQLRGTVGALMQAVRESIARGAQTVRDRQLDGARLLALIALFAVASSALIFWLYVWRGLLRRLTALSSATLAISGGNLDIELPPDTHDEIGAMTRALAQFRVNAYAMLKADKALRESEASFRSLIEGSIQGTVIHRDWTPLFANQACADMLGYDSPEDVMALDSVGEFCAAHERARLRGYAERRIRGEYAPAQYEMEAVRKDGSVRILLVAVSLTSWKRERAIQLAMVDVTEQRMAERELKASEARLRAFFNNSPQAMSIADLDGRYVEANKRVLEVYGSHRNDVSGKAARGFMPAPVAEFIERLDREVVAARTVKLEDLEIPSASGPTHVSLVHFPVRDGSGEVTGIGAIDTDVTEVVRSQRQATLLRDAIEAAQDGLILYDHEQRVVFTNAEFHRMHQPVPSPADIVGMTRLEIAQIVVRAGWVRDPLAESDPEAYIERFMSRHVSVTDEPTFANGRTYLRRHRQVADGAMLTILTDITDRKNAERAIAHSEAELRRLATEVSLAEERERRRIASDLHDGAIQDLGLARILFGSLVKSVPDGRSNPQIREIHGLLEQCIRELRTLLSELSPPALYDLGLLQALDWLTKRFHARHGLDCTLRAATEPPALDKNLEVLLFQTVRELLINVAKHAQGEKVDIRLWHENDSLSICVSDDGVGFDPATLAGPPSDTQGFGLFSVRERLRLLGGKMQVESDAGARITVSVPIGAVGRS